MSKEENFLLKWNNHENNLVGVFKDWLKDESFIDITFVCGGEIVLGHKVVIAACSPLLNSILNKNPCSHPIIILNDVSSSDMRALLNFIYHGEVSVSQSDLPSFLRTADNLQIKGLAEEKDDKKRKERDDYPVSRKKSRTESKHACSYKKMTSSQKKKSDFTSTKALLINNVAEVPQILAITDSASNHIDNDDTIDSLNECDDNSDGLFDKQDLHSFSENISAIKTEPNEFSQESLWHGGSTLTKQDNYCDEAETHRLSSYNSMPANQLSSTSSPYLPLAIITETNDSSTLTDSEKNDELDLIPLLDESKQKCLREALENHTIVGTVDEFNDDDQTCNTNSPVKFRGGRKPCCFCGKTFCDNYTLRRHMLTHLARQRQFECSLCSAAYSRKDHLMAHVRRKHLASEYEMDVTPKSS